MLRRLYTMAKQKDITRNPPSWLEKGLFVLIILLIIGIAAPIFMKINKTTFEFYACIKLQNEINECVDQWKEMHYDEWIAQGLTEKQISQKKATQAEIEVIYGGPLPDCPYPKKSGSEPLFKDRYGYAECSKHKYDETYVLDSSK